MKKLVAFILILLIPFYLLLSSVELTTFKLSFFDRNIEKNSIESVTSKDKDELMSIYNDLLTYLKGEDVDLSKNFNEREVRHMEDVENLFSLGFAIKKILAFTILLLIAYILYDRKNLALYLERIKKGLFIWWGGILVFFLLTLSDFTKYFTIFHEILFDNDLWLLDPTKDLMIQMLPENFFIAMFKKIIGLFLLGLFLLHLLIVFLDKKEKERREYA